MSFGTLKENKVNLKKLSKILFLIRLKIVFSFKQNEGLNIVINIRNFQREENNYRIIKLLNLRKLKYST